MLRSIVLGVLLEPRAIVAMKEGVSVSAVLFTLIGLFLFSHLLLWTYMYLLINFVYLALKSNFRLIFWHIKLEFISFMFLQLIL